MEAIERNHEAVVDVLLEHPELDINFAKPGDGTTALITAAVHGNANIVEKLLKHEAEINKSDYIDATPLFRAAGNGHGKAVDALLADPKVEIDQVASGCNGAGTSPLLIAV